jgi:hypothetical protein
MVASWPRSRSRDSNSPGPEAVPVNDQLLGVVTDCPPAQHLVVTMATTRARRPDARARCGKGPAASRHQQQVPAAAENR